MPRSIAGLITSVPPYLGLLVAMYFSLSVSYLLTFAIGVLAAGFLLRTYIVFHDCSHGSYLPSKRANQWLGSALGILVFAPFANWRHNHAVHHATAADLDRRGQGDVPTLTIAEYNARAWRGRLGYRLFRNPLVMFGLGTAVRDDPRAADRAPLGAPADPPQRARDERRARGADQAGAVARPGSHRTVRTLFVYGSSGRRVMTPAAGRFDRPRIIPTAPVVAIRGRRSAGASWRCRSTRKISPRLAKYALRRPWSTACVWLSAHQDLRPA